MRYQVLVDYRERASKCTILPLVGHPALDIVRTVPGAPLASLTGELLLHPDGEPLDRLAPGGAPARSLSAFDCTWRHLAGMLRLAPSPLPALARVPDGFVTAYPRRNKAELDPAAGLATIEAVFLAGAFLGHWDETLLSRYFFAPAFLALNQAAFARYRLGPSGQSLAGP